jgi:hypothetical protein
LFTYESLREKELRAPKFGIAGILFYLSLAWLILTVPQSRPVVAVFFGALLLIFLLLPYAVVIATEMDLENVGAGPHTPALVESSAN